MPDPPPTSALVRWTLENPWPLAVALAAIAGFMLWRLVRAGTAGSGRRSLLLAVSLLVPAVALLIVASFVETAGERARTASIALVEAAVAGDMGAVSASLAPGATLHLGSARNVGSDVEEIIDRLRELHDRRTIESNRITHVRAYTESRDRATVHLICSTEAGYGPTRSRWVLECERVPDAGGEMRVSRIVCISINGRPPPAGAW